MNEHEIDDDPMDLFHQVLVFLFVLLKIIDNSSSFCYYIVYH